MSSRLKSNASQRNRLFAQYDSRQNSQSPGDRKPLSGYGYNPSLHEQSAPAGAFAAYPTSSSNGHTGQYRAATPNSRGQYSDAVLSELESQNDEQVPGILGKVKKLKEIAVLMGDEIRDSSNLANSMNDSFDSTGARLRGTMNRMLIMAERTGVGWRVWLGFFAAVILLFWYVWLF